MIYYNIYIYIGIIVSIANKNKVEAYKLSKELRSKKLYP